MATAHAHPGLVAVTAGIPDADGHREFSSGLLIAPGLVLTSRHGVTSRDGAARPGITVEPVTGPRGAVQAGAPAPARIAWLGPGELDVTLLELADPSGIPDGFVPGQLAWGESVGTGPLAVSVTGLPGFSSSSTGNRTEAETARGNLEPGTYTSSDRYAVNLASGWPHAWKDWAGMSGAAVTCQDGGQLLGVVAWSDELLDGRRLTAVPARALLADAGFRAVLARHLGGIPELEPVELAGCLARPRPAGSLGGLLRADAALVDFTGRDEEIRFLEAWRDHPAEHGPDIKALLVTGRGGEGKTRLATEFLARSRRDGWVGGTLRPEAARAEAIASAARPLLLVIDYAAARAEETRTLVQAIVPARPRIPVRLLLLARAAGEWWRDLAAQLEDDLPGLEGDVLPLPALLTAGGPDGPEPPDRASVFTLTVRSLAPHLARFTGRTEAQLRELAASVPVPDLSGPVNAHVLTLQVTALVALLQRCDPVAAKAGPEDTLLQHEKKYRDNLARGRRELADLRPVRDRAVAAAALIGARGRRLPDAREAACSVTQAALSPDLDGRVALQRSVAEWIAEIYPPDDPVPGEPAEYWGTVLPDRLGEFLVVRLLDAEVTTGSGAEGLLESLAGRADAAGAVRALLILSRAAEHDAQAARWVDRLVQARPHELGAAALTVAAYAENAAPLRAALVRLGVSHRPVLAEVAQAVSRGLPRFSLTGLESSAGLTRELTLVYRELTTADRAAYLPGLAASVNNHAVRLAAAGRRAEAVLASAEAVALYRELAAGDRDGYLPGLASALNNHGPRLAQAGRRPEAVQVGAEAVALGRELAARDREAYLGDLAAAVTNQAVHLAEAGRLAEAAAVSAEAVTLGRELAARDRATHLPGLVTALNNHVWRLQETGRRAEAVTVSAQAVTLCRELAADNRDAYLPDLANALSGSATQLAKAGRLAEATAVSAQAVTLRRELAAVNRDAYLPDLANALTNHGLRLAETGQADAAALAAAEAVTLRREQAAVNRDAYLPDLANALNNQALRLAELGRPDQAARSLEEAVAFFRELAAGNRDAYLPRLAIALHNQASQLTGAGQLAEAARILTEAITLRRELVARDRLTYLPDLANSLNTRAALLYRAGQPAEAVPVAAEAASLARELVTVDRGAFTGFLARALRNQGMVLAADGRTAQAVPVLAETAALHRELAAAEPAGYTGDLAGLADALSGQAAELAADAQLDAALALSEQVLAIRRDLAAGDRAAWLGALADGLDNHAAWLAQAGRPDAAVTSWDESATLYRELLAADRDAYLPKFAGYLNNYAVRAGEDRPADALSALLEAVTAYRELAGRDPETYLPFLAMSLQNYSVRLARAGQPDQALPFSEEAVTISAQLVAQNAEHVRPHLSYLNTYGRLLLDAGELEGACEAGIIVVQHCVQQPEALRDVAQFALATLRQADQLDHARTDAAFREITGNSYAAWLGG